MKVFRTEIVGALVVSSVIIGAVVFFLSYFNEKQTEGRIDLYDLVLPGAEQILSVNKPFQFLGVLERQPGLSACFKSLIPEDYIHLLACAKHSPVLLAYYPQGVALYYHLHNGRDEISDNFKKEPFVSVKNEGIDFKFYPKASGLYLGNYQYKGVGVVSHSRKLLEIIADNHRSKRKINFLSLKELEEEPDREALLNVLFQSDSVSGWQTVDLFLHEEQVCCLYNRTFTEISDSLVATTGDSLKVFIEELIPGMKVQAGLSRSDSTVYYTFCTSLAP